MELNICVIDKARQDDIRLKNQPFPLWGRLLVTYSQGRWSHTVSRFPAEQQGEMVFPNEEYDYDAMTAGPEPCIFVGAYLQGECVGLAVLQRDWTRYLYLMDLKVDLRCRGQGVGTALLAKCREISREMGCRGLHTVAQDNNVSACLFYLKNGFVIGGLDTCVYRGTSQEGKADVLFYSDQEGKESTCL